MTEELLSTLWPTVETWERLGDDDSRWRGWDTVATFWRYVLADGRLFVVVPVSGSLLLAVADPESKIWRMAEEELARRKGTR